MGTVTTTPAVTATTDVTGYNVLGFKSTGSTTTLQFSADTVADVLVVGGGGRRMLSMMRTLTGTELRITVRGAERLKGLEDRLRAGNSLLRRAETRWQRAHQIHIRRFAGE